MTFTTKIDSIIFDLDGTLWDPTNVAVKAWTLIAEDTPEIKQQITKNDLNPIFGLPYDLITKKLFPSLSDDNQKKLIELYLSKEISLIKNEGGSLFSNIHQVLETLKNKYPLFIVSNCQKGYIEAFYAYHKMSKYFTDHECKGNTGKNKTFNINYLMQRNSLTSPVYVGDTQIDADASKENNIPFIYAKYGFGKVEKYSYAIENIGELLRFF